MIPGAGKVQGCGGGTSTLVPRAPPHTCWITVVSAASLPGGGLYGKERGRGIRDVLLKRVSWSEQTPPPPNTPK